MDFNGFSFSPSKALGTGSMYQYEVLQDPKLDIRLVSIEPGFPNDPIKCTIQGYPFVPLPKYRALSYVWGESTGRVPISLNGKRFLVTSNLESALRNLRQLVLDPNHSTERRLWVDAICIDQNNYEERDEQVRRMKSIYQNAKEVIIWLGDYEEPSDDILRSATGQWGLDDLQHGDEFVAQRTESILFGFLSMDTQLSGQTSEQRKETIALSPNSLLSHLAASIQDWAQLARLFHRPWFERLWVIQELGACRYATVQWGRRTVPWKSLELAAAYILRPPVDIPLGNHIRRILPLMGAHRLAQVALNSVRDIDKLNILTALWHTRGARCSDPRDRLYAILGVVNDTEDVQIDYASPVEIVYKNWTINRIKRTQSLDILGACAYPSTRISLPSWVPDLRQPWGQDKTLWSWTMQNSAFKELPGERYFSFSKHGSTLSVNGQYLARITALTAIGDVTSNLTDPTNLTPRLNTIITGWEKWALMQRPPSVSIDSDSIDMQKIVFETALLRGGISTDFVFGFNTATRYRLWRLIAAGDLDKPKRDFDLEREKEIVGNLEGQLFSMVHGNQVFATAGGNLGMVAGNCEAQVGDQLWLLLGGLTPFILRQVGDSHRLITPCYFLNHMMLEKHTVIAGPVQRVTLI